jgi:hypothetical protein
MGPLEVARSLSKAAEGLGANLGERRTNPRLVFLVKAGKKPTTMLPEGSRIRTIWETTRWAFHDVRY